MATPGELKKDIDKRFERLDKRLDRVLYILESDPKTKEKGLVETVNELKEDVNKLLLQKEVEKGKATVWGVVGGVVVSIGVFVVKDLLKLKIG